MKVMIRKYVIIAIVTVLLVHILAFIIDIIFPEILTRNTPDGIIKTYSFNYLSAVVEYFFNIVIAVFIYKDMKKENTINYLILIITFLSNLIGISLFILTIVYKNLIYKTKLYE